MKRQISILACLILVAVMVFALASCNLFKPEHTHSYENGVCGECGEKDPNYVPPHTHNFVDGKCECGEEDPNYVPHEHNFVNGKCECGEEDPNYVPECTEHAFSVEVTKAATCTEAGEKTLTCTLCGHVETSEIAPEGHTEEKVAGTAPTCTEAGLSDGKVCTVCDEVLVEQVTINATGHSFVDGTCSACGEADPNYNGPKTHEWNFGLVDGSAAKDKTYIADGTTYDNGYFTIVGEVYYRYKDGAIYCVEVEKDGRGAIQFTVTGTATVEVMFSSTGSTNTSWVGIIDADGNIVANNEGANTVTGANDGKTVFTYTLSAGTYKVVSPSIKEPVLDAEGNPTYDDDGDPVVKNPYSRAARVFYVNVTETPAEEAPKNEIKVTTTDTFGFFDLYTFTATESGAYTFTVPAGLGVYSKAQYDVYGPAEVDFMDNADGATFTVSLAAGATYEFYVGSTTKSDWVLTYEFVAGEVNPDDPGTDTPIEGDATELVVGSNNVVFADGELSEGKTYPFVVTEEGTYTFNGDLIAVVMDADGNTIGRGQVNLTAGTYSVTLFSMMPLPANSFTIRITFEAPSTGEPDGSEENPYVWETLPESVVVDYDVITGKVYYIFTATADGSVTFTWPVEGDSWYDIFELDENGNLTSNNDSGYMVNSHSFVVEAGKSYRVSLGSWSEAGSHTIAIAFSACAHEWSEATCETLSTCSKCGATTGDYADHIPNSENPTCADPAECTVCGAEVGYVPHEWNEGVVTQNPDCSTETNGIKLLTCTVCGATEEETIWAFHDWVVDENVAATCTTDGYYKAHCSVCNKIDEETSEAQGHYNYFEGTCGDTVACLECGESFVKEHSFWFEANCTQAAYCGVCEQYVGEPAGHQYAYPCDKFCCVCYEETNPNATHTIVHVDAVAATCYENGNVEYWYCSDCGATWTDEALTQVSNQMSIVTPMGHAPATHVEAKAPTCYENGNIEYWLCEACGQAWLDADCTQNTNVLAVVLPMAHAEATHVEAKAATCTADGNIEYWICEPCGQVWLDEACTLNSNVKSVVLPAPGHDYVDGICSVCDAVDPDHYFVVSISDALAAADGKKVQVSGTVCAINTAWSDSYGNISVTITDADGNELYLYRLKTNVALGDIITVKGTMATYNSNRQVAAGATATIDGHDSSYDYAELTIEEALAAADNTNVIVTGTVVKIGTAYSSQYNNISVYIADENGTQLYLYRLTGDVTVGQIIKVKGAMATYNGARQLTGGTYEAVGTHTCSKYTEATCAKLAACVVCGATTGELADHDYVDGVCSVCGAATGVTYTTVSKTSNELAEIAGVSISAGNTTYPVDGTEIALDNNVSVTFGKGTASTAPSIFSDGVRVYQAGGTVTINAAEGCQMSSIAIKVGNTSYDGDNMTVTGGTATYADGVWTIMVDADATSVVITTGTASTAKNARLYVGEISVTYANS